MTTEEQLADIADKVSQLPSKLPDLATGVVKGTADIVGFPVDMSNEVLGLVGLKSNKPKYGSKFIREALFGSVAAEDKNIVETVGTLINPTGVGKAMIIGAIPKLLSAGKSSYRAMETISELNTAQMMGNTKEILDLFKKHDIFAGHEGQAKSFLSDKNSKVLIGGLEPIMSLGKDTAADLGKIIWTVNDKKGPVPITEVFKHTQLFDAYPMLKDVRVKSMEGRPGNASFGMDEVGPYIRLTPEASPELFRSKILHELQHAVQEIESFTKGGNVKLSGRYIDPEFRAKLIEAKSRVVPGTPEEEKLGRIINKYNTKIHIAFEKYRSIPGEKEARFTEATKDLSGPELKAEIENLLSTVGNQQFWTK